MALMACVQKRSGEARILRIFLGSTRNEAWFFPTISRISGRVCRREKYNFGVIETYDSWPCKVSQPRETRRVRGADPTQNRARARDQ